MNLRDKIRNFPTKHKEGFLREEIEELLKDFPTINRQAFDESLLGITCVEVGESDLITYHCDIEYAIHNGYRNDDLQFIYWD